MINLPKIESPALIEAYETALSYELSSNIDNFSISTLIDLLYKNPNFANYGFYKGFAELLFTTIMSDSRATSEIWLISIVNRIMNLGVSDPDFKALIDNMIEENIERLANVSLIKLVNLLHQLRSIEHSKHKNMLLKRLRGYNPEHITDMKVLSVLLECIAHADPDRKDLFARYLQRTMNNV